MTKENQKEIILLKDLGAQKPSEKSKYKARFGLYLCHCGKEFKGNTYNIRSKRTTSCGCQFTENRSKVQIKHGLYYHRLYNTWVGMVNRCTKKEYCSYKNYGAKGITVCDEWLKVEAFINDMESTYQEGLSLDRIDNNKGYSKDNCRWATREVQARNKGARSNNKSGFTGVHWCNKRKRWIAQIGVNSRRVYLGKFKTALESAMAYDKYIIDNNLEHTLNGVIL